VRVVEDAGAVLFDQRRRTCHSLVVCYWAHLAGGVEALLGQLRHADALLDLDAGAPRAAHRGGANVAEGAMLADTGLGCQPCLPAGSVERRAGLACEGVEACSW